MFIVEINEFQNDYSKRCLRMDLSEVEGKQGHCQKADEVEQDQGL